MSESGDKAGEAQAQHPRLSEFGAERLGQPGDGIVWLYKSDIDSSWSIVKDADMALQEATGYPVGELIDHEKRGDYTESESGELRAIFVPPADEQEIEGQSDEGWDFEPNDVIVDSSEIEPNVRIEPAHCEITDRFVDVDTDTRYYRFEVTNADRRIEHLRNAQTVENNYQKLSEVSK